METKEICFEDYIKLTDKFWIKPCEAARIGLICMNLKIQNQKDILVVRWMMWLLGFHWNRQF